MIPVTYILFLSGTLFTIGVFGALTRKNVIIVFMCIELMLNACILAFVGFSTALSSMDGVMFVLFIMVVAAAEAVVGLAIIWAMFNHKQSLNIDNFSLLKN